MSSNHPALRGRRSRLYQRWSCFLCGQDGVGGIHGWQQHYLDHHHDTQGETA